MREEAQALCEGTGCWGRSGCLGTAGKDRMHWLECGEGQQALDLTPSVGEWDLAWVTSGTQEYRTGEGGNAD